MSKVDPRTERVNGRAENQDLRLSFRVSSPPNSHGQVSYRWKALNL